jgi:hypothetical protein
VKGQTDGILKSKTKWPPPLPQTPALRESMRANKNFVSVDAMLFKLLRSFLLQFCDSMGLKGNTIFEHYY